MAYSPLALLYVQDKLNEIKKEQNQPLTQEKIYRQLKQDDIYMDNNITRIIIHISDMKSLYGTIIIKLFNEKLQLLENYYHSEKINDKNSIIKEIIDFNNREKKMLDTIDRYYLHVSLDNFMNNSSKTLSEFYICLIGLNETMFQINSKNELFWIRMPIMYIDDQKLLFDDWIIL